MCQKCTDGFSHHVYPACVSGAALKFGNCCKCYRPQMTTYHLIYEVLQAPNPNICNCRHMHRESGLLLVARDVFIQGFVMGKPIQSTAVQGFIQPKLEQPTPTEMDVVFQVCYPGAPRNRVCGVPKKERLTVVVRAHGVGGNKKSTCSKSHNTNEHGIGSETCLEQVPGQLCAWNVR